MVAAKKNIIPIICVKRGCSTDAISSVRPLCMLRAVCSHHFLGFFLQWTGQGRNLTLFPLMPLQDLSLNKAKEHAFRCAVGLQDLFGLGDAQAPAAAAASDPLADLGFGAPAAPAAAPAFQPITVFDKDGVRVGFAFTKPPGQPGLTDISATFTNSAAAPVTAFSLQVRGLHLRVVTMSACQNAASV